jgi:hypothetical protein
MPLMEKRELDHSIVLKKKKLIEGKILLSTLECYNET